jgi:hypothetical protein
MRLTIGPLLSATRHKLWRVDPSVRFFDIEPAGEECPETPMMEPTNTSCGGSFQARSRQAHDYGQ